MPSSRPSKISNRQWEEHKSVIERLYLRDNLTLQGEDGCEGLIAYMSRVHTFDASLSQYEDRLKHWGIRKNLTQDDWITVKRMLNTRGAQGKESAVYVSGKVLKDSQVRKGISRPGVRNAVHQDTRLASLEIQLPSYLEVRSPELLPQQERVLQENTLHIPEDECQSTEQCPVSGEQSDPLGCSLIPSRSRHVVSTCKTPYMHSDSVVSGNCLVQEMVVCYPTTDMTDRETEPDIFLKEAIRKKVLEIIPADTISFIEIPSCNINIPGLKGFQSSSQSFSRITYIRSTRSIIPARHSYDLTDTTHGPGIMRIAIYELVNRKFHSQNHCSKPVEWIMRYFQQDRSVQSFTKLKKYIKHPTLLKALYRNLFITALRVKAYSIMNGVLVASAAPKSSVLSSILSEQDYIYELAEILYRGPSELVATIFQSCDSFTKAKLKVIQKSYDRSIIDIYHLRGGFNVYPENAKILRDEGFDLEWLAIAGTALTLGNFHHVKLIMRLVPDSQFRRLIEGSLPEYEEPFSYDINLAILAVRKLPEKDALWVIRTLVEYLLRNPLALPEDQYSTAGETISIRKLSRGYNTYQTTPLQVAVAREYDSVISYLISEGAQVTAGCLYEATSLKRMDMIQRLVKAGASPTGIVVHNESTLKRTTPYAEALRTGYHEAIRLFDQQPFVTPGLDVQYTLLLAASEIGDRERFSGYLEDLKREHVGINSFDTELQQCLQDVESTARDHGNSYILEDLFKSGLTPAFELFENAITSRDRDRLTDLFTGSNGTSSPGLSRSIAKLEDHDLADFILGCIDFQEDECQGEFLKQAIYFDNVALVGKLLHIGISPNSPFDVKSLDREKHVKDIQEYIGSLETPLIVAIQCRNKHIINMLLKHLAFLNPQPDDYRSSGHYFASNIDDYIQYGYRPRLPSALETAVHTQDIELVYDLIVRGADPYDSNALVGLVKLGNHEIIRTVLHKQGLKKHSSASNMLPVLIEALNCDNSDIAHLLSYHADLERLSVSDRDASFLRYRCAKSPGDKNYNFSVTMNALGRIIHGFACQKYSLGTVRTLLHCGSNTEAVCLVLSKIYIRKLGNSTDTFTPLNLAVFWDSRPLLNLLKEHGANINGSFNNLTKRTPLQLAAELGHLDMVSHLIRLSADVNWPPTPCKGFTALQLAAKHGFYRIAEVLLEHQAVVDWPAARICGRTAFEAATENGRLDMMLLLVRSGADLISSAGNKQFERAVTFAKARGEEPAITLAHELREIVQRVTLDAQDKAFDALLERGFA